MDPPTPPAPQTHSLTPLPARSESLTGPEDRGTPAGGERCPSRSCSRPLARGSWRPDECPAPGPGRPGAGCEPTGRSPALDSGPRPGSPGFSCRVLQPRVRRGGSLRDSSVEQGVRGSSPSAGRLAGLLGKGGPATRRRRRKPGHGRKGERPRLPGPRRPALPQPRSARAPSPLPRCLP